uniref:Glutamate-gated chloride channel n=1 Tax=Syphacia muris TaxID=451379 RepID=A0A0N5AV93_9BILA
MRFSNGFSKCEAQHLYCILLLLVLCDSGYCGKRNKHKDKTVCKALQFDRPTTNFKAWLEQHTICKLLRGTGNRYDAKVRPSGGKTINSPREPVVVKTSLVINSISAVSEKNMEYMAQFQFQQEWFDNRLNFEHLSEFRTIDFINVARDQKLWIPDTFFQNERNGWYHLLDQENKFIRVRSDGKVFYNRRLTLTLSCVMDLLRYPMDVQHCVIDFASYAYTTEDIIYVWDKVGIAIDPNANGDLPNFEITSYNMSKCDSITNTGTYSCLSLQLELTRVFSFFLLQLYIPSGMLVGVSWVSYWIDWKSTAARVPLAIITLLTMIAQAHAVNKNLPPVSYTKAIDVWIGACVVFIFASLIEYAVVNYMGILDEHRQMRKIAANRRRLSTMINAEEMIEDSSQRSVSNPQNHWNIEKCLSQRTSRWKPKNNAEQEGHELASLSLGTINTSSRSVLDSDVEASTVYLKHHKPFELVRWCNFLSTRGKAERIDIIARYVIGTVFVANALCS